MLNPERTPGVPSPTEVNETLPEGHYLLASHSLANVEKYVERLNKRAKKLGLDLPEVVVTVEREEFPVQLAWVSDGRVRGYYIMGAVVLSTTGEPPVLPGWEFIGAVDRLPDEEASGTATVFRMLPGHEVPEKVKDTPQWCDHCGTNRDRVVTYLVKNTETEEVKQVGSTCLKDFTGHKSADAVASWFALWSGYMETLSCGEDCWELDAGDGWHTARSMYLAPEAFLPWVTWSTRHFGWVSRSKAWDLYSQSTADHAHLAMMDAQDGKPNTDLPKDQRRPTEQDEAKAEAALEWAQNLTDEEVADSDYLYNVRQAVAAGLFHRRKHLGLVASIPAAHAKQQEREAREKQEAEGKNEHVGQVKERLTLTLTCVDSRTLPCESWETAVDLVKWADEEGRMLTWFTGSDHGWTVGETATVKATVKAHKEFRGRKETQVNRVTRQ